MSRTKKLFIAGLVLATGIGLAWPFRKSAPPLGGQSLTHAQPELLSGPGMSQAAKQEARLPSVGEASHVAAKMASTGEPIKSLPEAAKPRTAATNFDLANHPALAKSSAAASHNLGVQQSPSTDAASQPGSIKNSSSRPAYAIAEKTHSIHGDIERPRVIVHIVRNSDTLEKLAERYLDDSGRAMEIFDLNRDVLTNPHLLPIGAELKILAGSNKALDTSVTTSRNF